MPASLIKKETLAQMFSCELIEIFQKAFFTEHLRWLLLYITNNQFRIINMWLLLIKSTQEKNSNFLILFLLPKKIA